MELKETIEYVKKACEDVEGFGGDVTDDKILDVAVRIFNSQNFKIPLEKKNEQPKASEKQQSYLYGLGYDGDASKLSIQEAKELISELRKNKK